MPCSRSMRLSIAVLLPLAAFSLFMFMFMFKEYLILAGKVEAEKVEAGKVEEVSKENDKTISAE